MASDFQVDHKLDCKGLNCPLPVLKTKKAIDSMQLGQILEMVATDPGSIPDMRAWSNKTGHELLESRADDGLFWFYIRKAK